MKKSIREQLIEAKARTQQTATVDWDGLVARVLGKKARPTQGRFIMDPAPFKAYKGMAGCAKTSTIVGGELLRAITIPGYRGFIGRHNYNDLMQTGIPRFEEMVNRVSPTLIIDRDKTPPMRVWLQAIGGGISEIMFIGLKDYPGGYEWHHGSVDEADECDERIILGLKSRLRAPQPPGYQLTYGMDLAFNPPDETHWLYKACTGLDHEGKKHPDAKWLELYEPSLGENDENLPPNYYELNFAGMPQDMLDRLRFGKWGASFPGMPVYPNFRIAMHCREAPYYNATQPLLRFWDFGYRRPACIWAQVDEDNRLILIDEQLGENEEARSFVRAVIARTNARYPNHPTIDYGDPAATQKKDTGSTLTILDNEGVSLRFVRSTIEEGVRRLRFLLDTLTHGVPALTVVRARCPLTTRMLQGGYRMDESGRKPVKDGFYDHLADALRYGVVNMYDARGRSMGLPDMAYDEHGNDVSIPDTIEYDSRYDGRDVVVAPATEDGWDR